MKVAVIYQGEFPPSQKVLANDRRVNDITNGLWQHNHDTYLISPSWKKSSCENNNLVKINYEIKHTGNTKMKYNILNRISFLVDSFKLIHNNKTDIVLFYNTFIDCLFLMFFLRITKKKVVIEICDLHSKTNVNSKNSILVKSIPKIIEYFNPKFSDAHIGINQEIIKYFEKNSPNKPNIKIPILVDSDHFKPIPKKEESQLITIGMCGSFWDYEGCDLLIEAFSELNLKYNNLKLLIIGNTNHPNKTNVKFLIEKLKIKDKVQQTGYVTESQLIQKFNECDILVLPQRKNGFTIAAFPTVLAEYCAMGKPIVISKFGEAEYYFFNKINCLFFEEGNVQDLENKIEILINSKSLREQLGANVKKLAETEFNILANGERLNKFFEII